MDSTSMKEPDYKAMWNQLKAHMTYITQQGVMSLHPIIVMDCMDDIHARGKQDNRYDLGYQDGVNAAKDSVQEWYDPTP